MVPLKKPVEWSDQNIVSARETTKKEKNESIGIDNGSSQNYRKHKTITISEWPMVKKKVKTCIKLTN